MSRSLILVLSAFSALIALGALAHDALSPSSDSRGMLQMLGVLVVDALCWLRWRMEWKNVFLVPGLIVGAAMLLVFALLGVGGAVRFSSLGSDGDSSPNVLDLLLGMQGALMLILLWKDRFRGGGRPDHGPDPEAEEGQ